MWHSTRIPLYRFVVYPSRSVGKPRTTIGLTTTTPGSAVGGRGFSAAATIHLGVTSWHGALFLSRRLQRTRPSAGGPRAPTSAPPTITNQRPGLLSSSGNRPNAGSRLVGGRKKTETYIHHRAADDGAFHTCNEAPQRPSWWLWRGSSAEGGENRGGSAPLNPLHRMEKFSWISLFGGGGPKKAYTDSSGPGSPVDDDERHNHGARGGRSMGSLWRRPKTSASPQEQDMSTRSTSRFLQAAKALHGRKKGEKAAFTALLSDEQKLEIVNREIESKWWARFWYRPFRHITDQRLRSTKRLLHGFLFVCSMTFFFACVYLYYAEMKILESLTPEDKADYIYLVSNMRFSDIWKVGMEVLNKEDPLEALPASARYHIVMEEARRRGWTTEVDWTVKLREMHPNSALEEGDYLHVFYWVMMYVGSFASGGGSMFSTRLLGDPGHATMVAQQASIQTEPTSIGPVAPPPKYADVKDQWKKA